jgi:hypothetical protein
VRRRSWDGVCPPAHRTTGYSLGLRNRRGEAFLRFAWGTYPVPAARPQSRNLSCKTSGGARASSRFSALGEG